MLGKTLDWSAAISTLLARRLSAEAGFDPDSFVELDCA
jgi:hypothetical protein